MKKYFINKFEFLESYFLYNIMGAFVFFLIFCINFMIYHVLYLIILIKRLHEFLTSLIRNKNKKQVSYLFLQ